MDTLGTLLEIVATIVVVLLACVLGLWVALAAVLAAVPALLLAWVIDLLWGTGFVDALAWTWSIATIICLAAAGWIIKQLDGGLAALIDP